MGPWRKIVLHCYARLCTDERDETATTDTVDVARIAAHYERRSPQLTAQHGRWPDYRGEYWALCPFHDDASPGSFSFSERGFRCFSCGASGHLVKLAHRLGITGDAEPVEVVARTKPARPVWTSRWRRQPDIWRNFLDLPPVARTYYHERGINDQSIAHWRLGWGVIPSSRCRHPRAILPVFDGDRLAAIRGRAVLPEDTDEKWLQAAQSEHVLFGADRLTPGCSLTIAEAPYSVILAAQEEPEQVVVAPSSGASVWRSEWTTRIAQHRPASILIAYDNDDAGRLYAQRVKTALRAAGLRPALHRWPAGTPNKHDLADEITANRSFRLAALHDVASGRAQTVPDAAPESPPHRPDRFRGFIARWGDVAPDSDGTIPDEHHGAHVPLAVAKPPTARELDSARAEIDAGVTRYLSTFAPRDDTPAPILLVRASPGIGKTRRLVAYAQAWLQNHERGRVGIVMPRRDHGATIRAEAVAQHIDPDEMYQWISRSDDADPHCLYPTPIGKWMERGNDARGFCKAICGPSYMEAECRFYAQMRRRERIVLLQHAHLTMHHQLDFDLLLVDEDPTLGAFAWRWEIPGAHICPADAPTGNRFTALLATLQQCARAGKHLDGHGLLDALGGPDAVLDACGEYRVPSGALLIPSSIADATTIDNVPYNHAHHLHRLLRREAEAATAGREYPHRVILRGGNIVLLLRRELAAAWAQRPIVVFDATGQRDIYAECFGRPVEVIEPTIAPAGRVVQIYSKGNGSRSLFEDTTKSPKPRALRETLTQINAIRARAGPRARIGVITWQRLEDALAPGVADVTGHFYASRGTNDFADVTDLVVVGAPQPPWAQMVEVAAMLYQRGDLGMAPLVDATGQPIYTQAPRPFPWIGPGGFCPAQHVVTFADPRLRAIHWAYRDAELIQAAHRGRITTRDTSTVWLLTSLPVPELVPQQMFSIAELLEAPRGVDAFRWMEVMAVVARYEESGCAMTSRDLAAEVGVHKDTAHDYWLRLRPILAARGWHDAMQPPGKRRAGRPPSLLAPPTPLLARRPN